MPPVHKTVIFFPIKPQENSPLAGYLAHKINTILELCLQQMPEHVDGYTLGGGDGRWYDESEGWLGDQCRVIEIYTKPGFAGTLIYANGPAARYLASLSYLSCVQMGHKAFFAIMENQSCSGDAKGLRIGPSENTCKNGGRTSETIRISYDKILPSKFWLQLPFKAPIDDA